MTRKIYLLIFAAALTCAGCQQSKPASSSDEQGKTTALSVTFETRLEPAAGMLTQDSVRLSFTVVNNTDKTQRFCKWETPFEPRLGKYLEVKDEKGTEATFKGAMASRQMPPSPESYIHVPPHDSVKTVFNLAKDYAVKSGGYTVKYTGGGVSGLPVGNELKIAITRP